jgi:hypothetical protein
VFRKFLSIGTGFGVTVKASCLRKVGSFDTELEVDSDTDFLFRFLTCGFVPVVVPGLQVVLHDHFMPRLQGPATVVEKIRACEGFLRQYSDFMDEYPLVRTDFLHYIASLKQQSAKNGGTKEAVPVRAVRESLDRLRLLRIRLATITRRWKRRTFRHLAALRPLMAWLKSAGLVRPVSSAARESAVVQRAEERDGMHDAACAQSAVPGRPWRIDGDQTYPVE